MPGLLAVAALMVAGCRWEDSLPPPPAADDGGQPAGVKEDAVAKDQVKQSPSAKRPDDDARSAGSRSEPAQATAVPQAEVAALWQQHFEQAHQKVRAGDLAGAGRHLAELDALASQLNTEQTEQLAAVHLELARRLQAAAVRRRAQAGAQPASPSSSDGAPTKAAVQSARLAEARALVERGQLEHASRLLGELAQDRLVPTLRAEVQDLQATIVARQAAMERLQAAAAGLASADRSQVRQAQQRLAEEPDIAVPLLVEAARDPNPVVVRGALETLRLLRRPDAALPATLDVLGRVEQAESWPLVLDELQRMHSPGAGEGLLNLALSTQRPDQRQAALRGLASAADPPRRTLTELMPLLVEDGADLPDALWAAVHAVVMHHQGDLHGRRGFDDIDGAPDDPQQLDELAGRVAELASGAGEAAEAARALAIATRQMAAQPLPGMRVLAYGGQLPSSTAAAVLDGVWDSTEAVHLWRHPLRRGSIVLDLGSERTVAGVRVWNLNEPGGMHRGWKELAVYVALNPGAAGEPVAVGIVPPAPGAATTIDYSTTIPVEFARGRYVRLEARSVWREDSHAGLSEVDVLGF